MMIRRIGLVMAAPLRSYPRALVVERHQPLTFARFRPTPKEGNTKSNQVNPYPRESAGAWPQRALTSGTLPAKFRVSLMKAAVRRCYAAYETEREYVA